MNEQPMINQTEQQPNGTPEKDPRRPLSAVIFEYVELFA